MTLYARCEALSREEENALAGRVQAGDYEARDALVSANLWIAAKLAKKFARGGLESEDVFQAGVFGLISAAEAARPDSRAKFSTIASYRVFAAVLRALPDHKEAVVKPASARDSATASRKAEAELETLIGRPPTFGELVAHMGLSPEKAESLRAARVDFRRTGDGRVDQMEAPEEEEGRDADEERMTAQIEAAMGRLWLARPDAADAVCRRCRKARGRITAGDLAKAAFKPDTRGRRNEARHKIVMEAVAWLRSELSGD